MAAISKSLSAATAKARSVLRRVRKDDMSVGNLASGGGLKAPEQPGVHRRQRALDAQDLALGVEKGFNADQPRGSDGKFGAGDGGGDKGSDKKPSFPISVVNTPALTPKENADIAHQRAQDATRLQRANEGKKSPSGAPLDEGLHTRAAGLHDKAASAARAAGDKDSAKAHKEQAAAHRAAAKMHTIAKDSDGDGGAEDGDEGTASDIDAATGDSVERPHRVHFQGIPIDLDRPKGFVQSGVDKAGTPWTRTYTCDYGSIPNTQGGDGEGLDVFLGDSPVAKVAYWIHQTKGDPKNTFDELKLMLGFPNARAAKAAYLAHVPRKYFKSISASSIAMVKSLLGIEPQATSKAFVVAMKDAAAGQRYADDARSWVNERGLLGGLGDETDVAKAVLRMADTLGNTPNGMSSVMAKAYSTWTMDAWDAAHALPLDEEEIVVASGMIARVASVMSAIVVALFSPERANTKRPSPSAEALFQMLSEQMLPPGDTEPGRPPVSWSKGPPALGFGSGPAKPGRGALDAPVDETHAIAKLAKLSGRIVDVRKDAPTEELRYVLGIVLEPDVVDAQGDTYSADEIRKSEWLYMEQFRNIGLQHKALVNGLVVLVESYIAPVDMVVNGSVIKAGTWMMGANVKDDDLWAKIKAGDITGWSIAGFASREPL